MAELGQTKNSHQLIPGNAESILHTARSMATHGDMLHNAGAGLKRIDTPDGWRGEAADAFHETYQVHPRKWLAAGDAFHDAANALHDYSSALTWAQGQAAEAIHLWDAGEEHHGAAEDKLFHARSELHAAGQRSADTVGAARDKAPPAQGFWSQIGSAAESAADAVGSAAEYVGSAIREGFVGGVNAAASFLNSVANHPKDDAMVVGGLALAALGVAGDVGGTGLCLTGVGAVPGAALDGVSTGAIVSGGALATGALGDIASNAAGPDQVTVMASKNKGGGGSFSDKPGSIGNKLGASKKDVEKAIHDVKNEGGWRGNGKSKNPDVEVDTKTGEVYPKGKGGRGEDSIGNLYDYLDE